MAHRSLAYDVSDWHVDGEPSEHLVATATSYVEVGEGLSGGAVEFEEQSSHFDWSKMEEYYQPEHTGAAARPRRVKLQPASGSMIAFDNSRLCHRVRRIRGEGRRRLIAFHLVDPQKPQEPGASSLPRLLASQRKRSALGALAAAAPVRLPEDVLEHVWRFVAAAGFGASSLEELQEQRDKNRVQRLDPGQRPYAGGTGYFREGTGPVLGGTGLAGHRPSDNPECIRPASSDDDSDSGADSGSDHSTSTSPFNFAESDAFDTGSVRPPTGPAGGDSRHLTVTPRV